MSKNITVMGRVSLLDLANVARFLKQEGSPPKTQSELLRSGISVLSTSLGISEEITPIVNEIEAIEELKSVGITWDRESKTGKEINSIIAKIQVRADGD